MKTQILFGIMICSRTLMMAQPPPPAPLTGPTSTVTASISQFTYGTEGRIEGLMVAPNTLVSLPPDWAIQVEMLAKIGSQISVTGTVMPTASAIQIIDPISVHVAGRTLAVAERSQPVPYAGPGVIRSLNYGRQGEVNGFLLQNGIVARTPPFGVSDVSVLRSGSTISISGFARATPSGRTVVEVQSITANGQTIAMSPMPPDGPGSGPGRGPGRGRGPVGAAPPPPPPGGPPPPPPPDR